MIQDKMIAEIQELKLSGFTLRETYDSLKSRHKTVSTFKTVCNYYNMDAALVDSNSEVRKPMVSTTEPFRSVVETTARNPGWGIPGYQ